MIITDSTLDKTYDIIIVGGGPAGLTAAVYARRAQKSVLVIEKNTFGGQITYSPKVENIPGFTEISGLDFGNALFNQASAQGCDFLPAEVLGIQLIKDNQQVHTDIGDYQSRSIIIATGTKHRTLNLPNEQNLIGNGISFCATCDGAFYKDKDVAVIGGGNSAMQEALLLADVAKNVTMVQNLSHLTGEIALQQQINSNKKIHIKTNTVVKSLACYENSLVGVLLKNVKSTIEEYLPVDGMFLAIGLEPQNDFVKDFVDLDLSGYIISDEACLTKTAGIFVAGDCRTKLTHQVTTATADGAVAALAACTYLDNHLVK